MPPARLGDARSKKELEAHSTLLDLLQRQLELQAAPNRVKAPSSSSSSSSSTGTETSSWASWQTTGRPQTTREEEEEEEEIRALLLATYVLKGQAASGFVTVPKYIILDISKKQQ